MPVAISETIATEPHSTIAMCSLAISVASFPREASKSVGMLM